MTKVDKKQYETFVDLCSNRTQTHDTLRSTVAYDWFNEDKIGEVRNKGQVNEEYYICD